jgi:acyl carrier protein
MSREEVLNKLTDLFRDIFDDDDIVLSESTAKDEIEGWDSLANINLVVSIEDEFDINFSMDDIIGVETVGDLVDVIMKGL